MSLKKSTWAHSLGVLLALPLIFLSLSACVAQNEGTTQSMHSAHNTAPDRIRLVFTGDIMVHDKQLDIAKARGNSQTPYNFLPQFANVAHLLHGDLVIGNLETVLKGVGPYKGYPLFNSPDTLADALQAVRFNVLLLANNHILDHNVRAGLRTDSYLKSRGFTTAGISQSKESMVLPIVEVKGHKIGFINGTYGSNRPLNSVKEPVYVPILNEMDIAADVQNLRSRGADFIIASFHWGAEYKNQPNASQKAMAQKCFDAGVDVIVGHHPHILQPMEVIEKNGKRQFVAWSLGNFISSQRTLPRERTVILAVDLKEDADKALQLERISVAPLWVEMQYGVRAELIPTRFGALSMQEDASVAGVDPALFARLRKSSHVQNRLKAVDKEIINFLKLPPADSYGFHTVWQKPVQ